MTERCLERRGMSLSVTAPLLALLSLWMGAPPPAAAPAPSTNPNASHKPAVEKPGMADKKLGDGPVDFRCDNLTIYTKPNRNMCKANVVIRRGDMLVCCEVFEGFADENWAWQRFTCSKEVRAQRGIETVWADKAEFFAAENDLVLTGRPVLHRGDSILEGERVILDVKEDHARIFRPRGRMDMDANQLPKTPPAIPEGPLPAICPIPALRR